jgi:excisionase family DNA binding protein
MMLSNKVFLSLKEFSFFTGLTLQTTTKLVASGEIKSIRAGRRRLVPAAEVELFALQLTLFAEPDHFTGFDIESVLRKKVGR